jgi:hypothetical protein
MRSLRPISGASTEIEICAALRLILDSAWFSKSPKLAAFLTFVVGEALAGNADRIKGYTIAVDALGRRHDFDPTTDAIVRVDANRIRRALKNYYAADGAEDLVVIDLPYRHYVPTFSRRALCDEPPAIARLTSPPYKTYPDRSRRRQSVLDTIDWLTEFLVRVRRGLQPE